MALTGKTIGQLTYLEFPTIDTLIPVELSGDTYHINFSGINYSESTYADLTTLSDSGSLIPGQYYLMTDFQTFYDRPDFANTGAPITESNYANGPVEPLLLLATTTTGFSTTAYSTLFPQDKISFDFSFSTTEVTGSPAKGRITERIDTNNNRGDYDIRNVEFLRYDGFYCETLLPGKITIDGEGLVTGENTNFLTNFPPGSILGVFDDTSEIFGSFMFYEVLVVVSDLSMTISGITITPVANKYYGSGNLLNSLFPYRSNIASYNVTTQLYPTFENPSSNNNYLGNNESYDTFILSNNVFINGVVSDNHFSSNVCNNTFNDNQDFNTCAPGFLFNVIYNRFQKNSIGPSFLYNIIIADFRYNQIGDNFRNNMLGNNDGYDFEYNVISTDFLNNFLVFSQGDFANNNIGWFFSQNVIDSTFRNNSIKGFFISNFVTESTFTDNNIGQYFGYNVILDRFYRNDIGANFYSNFIYSSFEYNNLDSNFGNNILGDVNNLGVFAFNWNNLGSNFENNVCSGNTTYNTIGSYAQNNNSGNNFSFNQIGSYFAGNTIAADFGYGGTGNSRGNTVGSYFRVNNVGENCFDNTFGDGCNNNTISDNFTNNQISHGMNFTIIGDFDAFQGFKNNIISYGDFSDDLTLSGGTGGRQVLYSQISTNITKDAQDSISYVTYLSGGTIVAETITTP